MGLTSLADCPGRVLPPSATVSPVWVALGCADDSLGESNSSLENENLSS